MSLYGDFDQQFRPRPSALALLSVGTAAMVISACLVSLLETALLLALAVAGGIRSPLAVYAPFPPSVDLLYRGVTTKAPLSFAPVITAAAALLFALLVARFWPTDQRLATRISVLTLAMAAGTFGGLALAFEPSLFVAAGGLPPMAWAVLAGAFSAWSILLSERALVDLLGTIFPAENPAARVRLWLLRIMPGLVGIALLAWIEGRRPVALASLATAAITFLENISRRPRRYFEDVREAPMREASLVLPVVAIIAAGSLFWAFGLRAAGRPPRAMSRKGGSIVFLPLTAGALPGRIELQPEPKKPEKKPRIRARWSKDRGKDGAEIVLP